MVGIDVVVWPVVVWNIQIGSGCSPVCASENCTVQSGKIQEHPSTEISRDKFFADTKKGSLDLPTRSFVTSILEPLVSDLLRSCSDGPKLVTSTLGDHAAITSKLFWQQSDFFMLD